MTPEERRRLDLAYRVWHDAAPSDAEVERAVRRISRSARLSRAPARSKVRLGPAMAVAVALVAVLAYASPGSRARLGELSARVFDRAEQAAGPTVVPSATVPGAGAGAAARPTAPGLSPRAPAAERTPEPPASPSARPATTPHSRTSAVAPRELEIAPAAPASTARFRTGEATWQDVNRALAANDEASASELLRDLERTGEDPATRAKATLGLAQLALGRDDCASAQRLARQVTATPGLDEKIIHRAHTVLIRCETEQR